MNNYLVYKHTSPSGKSYIGITNNYKRRCQEHRLTINECVAFGRAIQKHGWDNFTHTIIASNISLEEANTLEQLLILEYNTLSPNGYNLTTGGKVCLLSEETKAKMSVNTSSRGRPMPLEHKARLIEIAKTRTQSIEERMVRSLAQRGKKMSQESIDKRTASHKAKGRTLTPEHKAKLAEGRRKARESIK